MQIRLYWAQPLLTHHSLEKLNDRRLLPLFKNYVAIALSLLIASVSLGLPSQATAQSAKDQTTAQSTKDIENVRARVQLLSTSRDSQVEVRFRDKTKIKGYITSVEPLTFSLKDSKAGTSQSITYAEVDSVSKAGGGPSTKTFLIIGGIAVGVVATWLIVKPAFCDGGAQTRGIC
jgi:hypothetical protein